MLGSRRRRLSNDYFGICRAGARLDNGRRSRLFGTCGSWLGRCKTGLARGKLLEHAESVLHLAAAAANFAAILLWRLEREGRSHRVVTTDKKVLHEEAGVRFVHVHAVERDADPSRGWPCQKIVNDSKVVDQVGLDDHMLFGRMFLTVTRNCSKTSDITFYDSLYTWHDTVTLANQLEPRKPNDPGLPRDFDAQLPLAAT